MKINSPRIEALRDAANIVRGFALQHPQGSEMRLQFELCAARIIAKAEIERECPDPFNSVPTDCHSEKTP